MADKLMINSTTSSKTLDGLINDKISPKPVKKIDKLPKTGEVQILNKLAQNISESYQLVKQRQQRYNELSARTMTKQTDADEWQEVSYAKNKLKRKKQLSSSLTSVTDSVNQEKRTRIEGIQLNCRGKLLLPENAVTTLPPLLIKPAPILQRVVIKSSTPKLPATTTAIAQPNNAELSIISKKEQAPPAPPRLKRKVQENVQTIQKLNAITEQLRLEINDLKSNLLSERGAVRVLRAQNEAETRKYQKELKKMQATLDLYKKNYQLGKKPSADAMQNNVESLPSIVNASLSSYEMQRLNNEITALKDANRALEDKRNINCDADRRKAADIRTLKDSYEIRLTQLTKSAKNEISRLLEELKTKERNIGQLKKDLQSVQNKNQNVNKNLSRNATKPSINIKSTTSNLTNQTTNKLSKNIKNKQQLESNEEVYQVKITEENDKDITAISQAQHLNELNKLKDFELLTNTKNLQNNINQFKTTAKILTNSQSNNKLKLLNTDQQQQHLQNAKATTITTTARLNDENCGNLNYQNHREYHSLPHEITERLLGNTTITTVTTTPTTVTTTLTTTINAKAIQKQQNEIDAQEYNKNNNNNSSCSSNRTKEQNSDSDSALSSAPTSISPQPPPGGLETADIWQMIRSYTTDMEKLQTNIDELQKENIELRKQLDLAKQQILENEKTALKQFESDRNLEQLMKRIKLLEEREHELESEANELREQNELLEFRIIELEEGNDKWSLQSHSGVSATSSASATANGCHSTSNSSSSSNSNSNSKNVWQCTKNDSKDEALQLIFGAENIANLNNNDSGITSPQSQRNLDMDLQLYDTVAQEQLLQRINNWLQKTDLTEEEQNCLQQVLNILQQLEMLSTQRGSGPASLNTNSSASDEVNSLEMAKPRFSDYNCHTTSRDKKSSANTSSCNNYQSRIVATVQPYGYSNNTSLQQVPSNTPSESPRKSRYNWQTNSLSESGVFVECDFLSDNSVNATVSTQTELQQETLAASTVGSKPLLGAQLSNDKRLQYYQERLQLLESKVLIYESSGDLQAKRLADRLQREIQLEKELREVQDRVEFLESENCQLEEEKCEFEEAENDTRLRLQRLEVELDILSQRNIELEVSREALNAKYKDCHSESLLLKDDLHVSETRIEHLQQDKQLVKENLEFLHNLLPLFLCYNACLTAAQLQSAGKVPLTYIDNMGNMESCPCNDGNELPNTCTQQTAQQQQREQLVQPAPTPISYRPYQPKWKPRQVVEDSDNYCAAQTNELPDSPNASRDMQYLKDEIKCLRNQIKMMNARHFEALETADSHWLELEREYKDREEAYRAKEVCLKQKINKLQDCLRDDARAANEKIGQLEDVERELKTCLKRLSKEHHDMCDQLQTTLTELDCLKNKSSEQKTQMKPLCDALDDEKKHCKMLSEELNYMRKLQQETEKMSLAEVEAMRTQMFDMRKEFLHIEVTNSELKEEVNCLECKIKQMECNEKKNIDKIRELCDEVRTKEEAVQKLEKRLERSDGFSLAQELNGGSPSKRFKREDVTDLRTAANGLTATLHNLKDCDFPSQQDFKDVAFEVKKLADKLLYGNASEARVSTMSNVVNDEDKKIEETRQEVTETAEMAETAETVETAETADEKLPSIVSEQLENSNADAEQAATIIGMALLSQKTISPALLASLGVNLSKKQICEVPSQLRKLSSKTDLLQNMQSIEQPMAATTKLSKKKRKFIRRKHRETLHSCSSMQARIRRIVCNLNNRRPEKYYDASEMDMSQTETLQRSISYDSFQSLTDQTSRPEFVKKIYKDASTDTIVESNLEVANIKVDKAIGTDSEDTAVHKCECSVQVNDDMNSDNLLKAIPSQTRSFLYLIKSSVAQTDKESDEMNAMLLQQWQEEEEFREGLQILQNYVCLDPDDSNVSAENYEHFVKTLSALHSLQDLFKPTYVPILDQLEDQVNEQLMAFHNKKMESQFYCTVYYPVKRQVPLNITDFLIKKTELEI